MSSGVLSKGHFMEVSRTDLIAGYQGQTAQKVKDVIDKAKGGVLFIDEAYSITENDHTDSYGRECLTELTKALEDYRDNLVVIVAGYTEPMRQFFDSNPGLRSRFNTFIEFDDYNADELMQIIKSMCVKEDYSLTEKSAMVLGQLISEAVEGKEKDFLSYEYATYKRCFDNVKIYQTRAERSLNVFQNIVLIAFKGDLDVNEQYSSLIENIKENEIKDFTTDYDFVTDNRAQIGN